jgi:hypothetical protein
MATWPSGSKASTQYTDQPTDRIADARAEINQTIANQGEIIDMFDIASPSDGDILSYNSTNSRFESGSQTSGGCLIIPDQDIPYSSAATVYSGGWSLGGNTNMGVSVVNSSDIQIEAGEYIISVLDPRYTGSYGSSASRQSVTCSLRDTESDGGSSIASFTTKSLSFYHRVWGVDNVRLQLSTTDTYQFYFSMSNSTLSDLAKEQAIFLIQKIG